MTPAEARTVFRFNFDPISYGHPSWWPRETLPERVFQNLLTNRVAASILSKKMLVDLRIDDEFDFDFTHPFKRIAFLTYKQQKQIIFQLGLGIYRARIARMISATEQSRLFKMIDYADYLLVLRLKFDMNILTEKHLPVLPITDRRRFYQLIYLAGFTLVVKIISAESQGFQTRFYLIWPKKFVLKRLTALRDNALSEVQLGAPAVIAAGRELMGGLLSIRDY